MKNLTRSLLLGTAFAMTGLSSSFAAGSDVMFVLDASNSMWGRVDGRPKIEIAKEVLLQTAVNLPAGTRTGLIAYGHRFNHELKECSDMELVDGYHNHNTAQFKELLDYVTPKGQTPIAGTLLESIPWVSGQGAQNPTVVLITDGVESCDGDVCAAATALAQSGINTKIHVVGYDLGSGQREQVQCIAENGNGKYFEASNAVGLQDALQEVTVEVAQEPVIVAEAQPKPAATPPSRELYFVDEFDGDALSGSWDLKNEDLDSYLVENSEMLMVSSDVQGFKAESTKNLMNLVEKMPAGDWDLTTHAKFEMQTGVDSLWFGLYKDSQNYMAIQLWSALNSYCKEITLRLQKAASGKITQFDQRVSGTTQCGYGKGDINEVRETIKNDGIILTLSKRGRNYTAHAKLPGMRSESSPPLFSTSKLT